MQLSLRVPLPPGRRCSYERLRGTSGNQPLERRSTSHVSVCPTCGTERQASWRCVPMNRAIGLLGSLAIIAGYFMPWFGTQGVIFTGNLLTRFLGGTTDLRQVLPGIGPSEVQLLRALVLFFPVAGAVGLALLVATFGWPRLRRVLDPLASLVAALTLAALAGGLRQLPRGSSLEVGVWVIGAGAFMLLLSPWVARPRGR